MSREKILQTLNRNRKTFLKSYHLLYELSQEKDLSSFLSLIPLKEMGFDLNKREFCDTYLRYDSFIPDKPAVCVCGDNVDIDHAICKNGGFVTMIP